MMIEQPLGHDDIIDHATLQKNIHTSICLDESIHSFDDVRHAIQLGSCRVINIKIGRVGGLTEAKRIHDYCRDRSEEHTSELQSRGHLVCRLQLEKKKK